MRAGRIVAERAPVIAYSIALGFFAVSDSRLKHDIELLGRLDNGLG